MTSEKAEALIEQYIAARTLKNSLSKVANGLRLLPSTMILSKDERKVTQRLYEELPAEIKSAKKNFRALEKVVKKEGLKIPPSHASHKKEATKKEKRRAKKHSK